MSISPGRRGAVAVALVVAADAGAQDSGADLLDVSRRAAVVDEVLADHLDRMSATEVFGTDQRLRVATNFSYYLVSDLALTTPEEGTFDVQLSRAYVGFLVDWLARPSEDGTPGEQIAYFTGGGIAYGLSRPFDLPLPASTTGTATSGTAPGGTGELSSSWNDLTGTQYSDEQYALGGRWKGFHAEGAWARGQQLDARADGRAATSTLEQRLNRAQLVVDSPVGLRFSTRVAIGGAVENVAVGLRVNDAVDAMRRTDDEVEKVPALTLGFRKSDYEGDDARSHPRVVGAGLEQDLSWLFGRTDPGKGSFVASTRSQADLDLSARHLQLALGEGELGWFGRGEVAGHIGASWFQDAGLADVIGRTSVAGVQGGMHLGVSLRQVCREGIDPKGNPCTPHSRGLRTAMSYSFRQSWAEELRYVGEYAGKPQSYVYFELLGGA